jgi:hypothetical protein
MIQLEDPGKLRGEYFREDLETYRKIENWGVSLFLGALGLVGKQLIEWDCAADPLKRVTLSPVATTFPAFLGLAAFIFLRVLNFRMRRSTVELFKIMGANLEPSLFGCLGWLMATMPLVLGLGLSKYLAGGNTDRMAIFQWVLGAAIAVFIIAWIVHLFTRWNENSRKRV